MLQVAVTSLILPLQHRHKNYDNPSSAAPCWCVIFYSLWQRRCVHITECLLCCFCLLQLVLQSSSAGGFLCTEPSLFCFLPFPQNNPHVKVIRRKADWMHPKIALWKYKYVPQQSRIAHWMLLERLGGIMLNTQVEKERKDETTDGFTCNSWC